MRISRIGLVVVGTMLALTACGDVDQTPLALAQEGTTTAMNGISVSGRGEVFGTPDTLTVTIGISVGRSTVSEAVDVAAGRLWISHCTIGRRLLAAFLIGYRILAGLFLLCICLWLPLRFAAWLPLRAWACRTAPEVPTRFWTWWPTSWASTPTSSSVV